MFCGLESVGAERIREVARAFVRAGSHFIKVGYDMTRNGGGNAMRAVTLLPALTGAWQHRGGGASLFTSGSFGLNTSRHLGAHLLKPSVRHVNMNLLASSLEATEGPLKALFVFNSNSAGVAPDSSRVRRGLAREDSLTVVLEHFQTDTADYADYLLPITTFLEHTECTRRMASLSRLVGAGFKTRGRMSPEQLGVRRTRAAVWSYRRGKLLECGSGGSSFAPEPASSPFRHHLRAA